MVLTLKSMPKILFSAFLNCLCAVIIVHAVEGMLAGFT